MRSVDFASTVFLIVVTDSTLLLGAFPASSFIHIILIGITLHSGFRDSHFTQTKDSDTWDFSFFLELLEKSYFYCSKFVRVSWLSFYQIWWKKWNHMWKADLRHEENFDDIIRAPEISYFNYWTLHVHHPKKSYFWLKMVWLGILSLKLKSWLYTQSIWTSNLSICLYLGTRWRNMGWS